VGKYTETHQRFDCVVEVGMICCNPCFEPTIIVRATGGAMLLSPPLVITKEELDGLLDMALMCLDLTAKDIGMM